jgi:hypothetical protein
MNKVLLLLLAISVSVLTGCDKEKNSQTEYIACKVNGVKWESGPSSISADWTTNHISIACYDQDENVSLSLLVMEDDLRSGIYSFTGKNMARYVDSDISSGGYFTDSLHNGTITLVLDEQNHRVSGTFSFEAKFETSGDVIKVTEGRFSALEIKN